MSKLEPALTRRECLLAFSAAICALSLTLPTNPRQALTEAIGRWIKRFGAQLGERETLLRWGQLYLAGHPAERDLPQLAQMLGITSGTVLPVQWLASIEKDFRAGDLAVVEGWVLARTEARVCALLHLANGYHG